MKVKEVLKPFDLSVLD